jgi:hypothetical protein
MNTFDSLLNTNILDELDTLDNYDVEYHSSQETNQSGSAVHEVLQVSSEQDTTHLLAVSTNFNEKLIVIL